MKMTREQFHRELESILEAPAGSLNSESNLEQTGHWDSMAILALISFADLNFSVPINGPTAAKAVTVADLEKILGDYLDEAGQESGGSKTEKVGG